MSAVWLVGVGSAVFAVLFLLGVSASLPWVLARLPADYLQTEPPPAGVLRNVVGWIFIFLGGLMLVLPGQGLLTILVGVMLADVPWKRRFIQKLFRYEAVFVAVNAARARARVAPLLRELDRG